MDCLETMESELKVPVVASNPAMIWYMLSKLELKNQISGYGKLLETWPALPDT
jgi:maleate cis-trans isomerase